MPQFDRYKKRIVNIEFVPVEDFYTLPYTDRFTIILITDGSVAGMLNGRPMKLTAPDILCISSDDKISVSVISNTSAQSFSFHTDFLRSERISEIQNQIPTKLRIQTGMSLFRRDDNRTGVYPISAYAYSKIFEWFFVLGTETLAQSNALWACRIKKYLIQILELLEQLNHNLEQSPLNLSLEYIYTNYSNKVTLKDLTHFAHLNRVSLNEIFKEQFGCTAMYYLMRYRLQIAGDLLMHTDMSLNEIARSTGFEYDTYFIKQFTGKRGLSPTTYRILSREQAKSI